MNTKKSLLVLLLSLVLCVTALGVNIFAEEGGANTAVEVPISGVTISKDNLYPALDLGDKTLPKSGLYRVDLSISKDAVFAKTLVRTGIQVDYNDDGKIDANFVGFAGVQATTASEHTISVYAMLPAGQPSMQFYEYIFVLDGAGTITPTNAKFTLIEESASDTVWFIPTVDMLNGAAAKTVTYWCTNGGAWYNGYGSSASAFDNIDTVTNGFISHTKGKKTRFGFHTLDIDSEIESGGVHFIANSELRFKVNVPSEGYYKVTAPYYSASNTTLTWKTKTAADAAYADAVTKAVPNTATVASGATATGYGEVATALYLAAGDNYISLTSSADRFALSAMMFEKMELVAYEGLSVRTEQDFAGLRSVYTVDRAMIEKLEGEGKKITFGVLAAGVTKTDGTTLTPDMTIAVDGTGKITSNGAKMVIVHDSTGANTASNTYTNAEKTEFAYTVAYFNDEQTSAYLQTAKLTFRAFYVVDGVITYVDMQGQTFGTQASLYDVATAWKDDASLTDKRAIYNILQKVDGTAFEGFDELHTVTFTDADGIVSQQKLYNGEDAFVSDFMLNGYKALTPVQIEEITAVTGDVTITLTKKES